MFDWNDLKHFLAVARQGSTLGASRVLGVNQTTVARRIAALEAACGLKLFERGQTGASLTEAGAGLVAEAESLERAATRLEHRVKTYHRGMAGTVRVTTNESMANLIVTPALAEFRRLYPDIRVELAIADRFMDIARGEADVAIRGATALEDSGLLARKVVDLPWAVYCSRDYAERCGKPASEADLSRHVLIDGEGPMQSNPMMVWLRERAPGAVVGYRGTTLNNLLFSAKAGLGIAALPCVLADREADLEFCMLLGEEMESSCWLVTRPELKAVPRIRAFMDFIGPHIVAACRQASHRV